MKTLAAIVASLALTGCTTQYVTIESDSQQHASTGFMQLPQHVPSGTLNKYPLPQADATLLHVRQVHYGLDGSESERMHAVQSDIYDFLTYLIQEHDVQHIYVEAFTEDFTRIDALRTIRTIRNEALSDLEVITKEYEHLKQLDGSKAAERRLPLIADQIQLYVDFIDSTTRNKLAAERLFIEGKITILPAESAMLNERANQLMNLYELGQAGHDEAHEVVFAHRDDYVLSIISGDAVVVFGAGHMFGGEHSCGPSYEKNTKKNKDNIDYHYQKTGIQYQLIEFTPRSLKN